MVSTLRDKFVAAKFSDRTEIIQLSLTIPNAGVAGDTVTGTSDATYGSTSVSQTGSGIIEFVYTPPSNSVFVAEDAVSGAVETDAVLFTLDFDRTYLFNRIRSSPVFEHLLNIVPGHEIKNRMRLKMENINTVDHTVDFMVMGFLIDIGQYKEFEKAMRGY